MKPGPEDQVRGLDREDVDRVANSHTGAAGGPESKVFKQNQVKFQLVRKLLTILSIIIIFFANALG